jgi:hypothetical protein
VGDIQEIAMTIKEQVVHGRIFQTIDEFRQGVRDFVTRYNAERLALGLCRTSLCKQLSNEPGAATRRIFL